jgi:hypothetical protein
MRVRKLRILRQLAVIAANSARRVFGESAEFAPDVPICHCVVSGRVYPRLLPKDLDQPLFRPLLLLVTTKTLSTYATSPHLPRTVGEDGNTSLSIVDALIRQCLHE